MSNGNCEPSVTVCNVTYDYDVGDQVRLGMTFIDQQTELPTDPDTVQIKIVAPDLTEQIFIYGQPDGRISRSSEGVYAFELLFEQSGDYHYHWLSTGHGAGSYQSALGVKPIGPIDCPSVDQKRSAAIVEMINSPRKVQGDEGSVEERSISEVIEADRYLGSRETDPPLHGIRLARVKPNGTV